jgi:hypothetical protein
MSEAPPLIQAISLCVPYNSEVCVGMSQIWIVLSPA